MKIRPVKLLWVCSFFLLALLVTVRSALSDMQFIVNCDENPNHIVCRDKGGSGHNPGLNRGRPTATATVTATPTRRATQTPTPRSTPVTDPGDNNPGVNRGRPTATPTVMPTTSNTDDDWEDNTEDQDGVPEDNTAPESDAGCWSEGYSDGDFVEIFGKTWRRAVQGKHCLPEVKLHCYSPDDPGSCYQVRDMPAQFGCGGIRARLKCDVESNAIFGNPDGSVMQPALVNAPETVSR